MVGEELTGVGVVDLRHAALILDAGRKKADELQDAALSAALSAMTEMAVVYAIEEQTGRATYGQSVAADFNELAEGY